MPIDSRDSEFAQLQLRELSPLVKNRLCTPVMARIWKTGYPAYREQKGKHEPIQGLPVTPTADHCRFRPILQD